MGARRVYDEELAEIVERAAAGESVLKIARALHRSPDTIARQLSKFKPTGTLARRYYETQQYQLAQRVVAQANVEQILEVQDRLDVLPKKRDAGGGGPQVLVCIGMPGQPALPVPTVKQLQGEVIDAKR